MRLVPALAASLTFCLPTVSFAYCFSIYTPRNQLVYQSTATPIDLSQPISAGLRARYPDHHLVFIPDQSRCTNVGTASRGGNLTQGDFANASAASIPVSSGALSRRRADRE